jgi:RNA polymerase sigma-70 factor (ECF subfamily)
MRFDAQQTLQEARGGSDEALGQLLESYQPYLVLLARVQIGQRLRGKVDPDDLVQEVFLEAHRQFAKFRGTTEQELTAWLRSILAGRLTMTVRRYVGAKGRDVRLERELAARIDQSSQALERGLAASISTPSQQASRREQAVLLAEALGRLPPDYREVIIQHHMEGLTFTQVGKLMDRSEDSIQKLWVRGLAALRRTMGGAQ